MVFGYATAQTSYVGDGSTVYFNGSILTNQVIVPDATATVNQTANTTFTGTGFVDGTVHVLKDGTNTIVPVGDGSTKSTITVATANSDDIAAVNYYFDDPATIGTTVDAGTNYYLSDTEYWQVSKVSGTSAGYSVSGTTANAGATYENVAPTGGTKVVWYDGSKWVEYTGANVVGYFSYAGENTTLGVDDNLNLSQFSFYPNPVSTSTASLNFNLPSSVQQLDVTMFDLTGKVIQRYKNVPVQAGANSIAKPQVANGMYLLQFSFNNGAQQVTKRIIIE